MSAGGEAEFVRPRNGSDRKVTGLQKTAVYEGVLVTVTVSADGEELLLAMGKGIW